MINNIDSVLMFLFFISVAMIFNSHLKIEIENETEKLKELEDDIEEIKSVQEKLNQFKKK